MYNISDLQPLEYLQKETSQWLMQKQTKRIKSQHLIHPNFEWCQKRNPFSKQRKLNLSGPKKANE